MKPNAIFIIGSGRSGTHLLCKSLLGYRNVNDGLDGQENSKVLESSTISAIMHRELDEWVIKHYKKKISEYNEKNYIFVDQSHTNLFNVKQLRSHFPNAIFLMTERDTVQIVSSYMEGYGKFRVWINWAKVNDHPLPNRFLGTTTNEQLMNTPRHVLATMRTQAVKEEMARVYKEHKDVVYKIKFEDMILKHKTFLESLDIHIGSDRKFVTIREDVLTKYNNVLSQQEQEEIANV